MAEGGGRRRSGPPDDDPDAPAAADEDDASDDQPPAPAPSSSRQQRNRAEKQRRDKLNNYITELASLVPMVSTSPKRLDKTSILRLSAVFLRIARCSVLNASEQRLKDDNIKFFVHLWEILSDMEGFLLVVDGSGKILVATDAVEKLLGHSQNDMLGHSLYSFTAQEHHAELRRQLTPDGEPVPDANPAPVTSPVGVCGDDSISSADSAASSSAHSSLPAASTATSSQGAGAASPGPSTSSVASPGEASSSSAAVAWTGAAAAAAGAATGPQRQRRDFVLSMAQKSVSRGEGTHYEPVTVQGYLHVPARAPPPPPPGSRSQRRQRETPAPSPSDIVLVAVVRQVRENKVDDFALMEASHEEYVTRHFRDGRIVYSDHRISMVAGYLSDEVSGCSAFQFMHQDDVSFTVVALQQMYDLQQGSGGSAYRLRAKTGDYIYLRTTGFLDQREGSEETLVCINTLLTKEEGERLVQEMKRKYAAAVAQIAQRGSPLIEASSCEILSPTEHELPVAPAPLRLDEPLMVQAGPSPSEVPFLPQPGPPVLQEAPFSKRSPHSEPLHSPARSTCSPGSMQFDNLTLYSPPAAPQVQYPGVITGPPGSTPPVIMERPSVITSVLTTVSAGDSTGVIEAGSSAGESSLWSFKEGSVLKRAFREDRCSSKRLHTDQPRRRQAPPPPAEPVCIDAPVPPPPLSPQEQHEILIQRGAAPATTTAFVEPWPPQAAHSPQPLTPATPSVAVTTTTTTAAPASFFPLLSPTQCAGEELASLGPLDELLEGIDNKDILQDLETLNGPELVLMASDFDQTGQAYSLMDRELEKHHEQLEKRMQSQASEMTLLKDLQQCLPDQQLQTQLSQLEEQHKQQQKMLHTLKQDHHVLQRQEQLGSSACVKQV